MTAIPLHIVSGFLGSGKTTFLKEIIRQVPEKIRIGIIQNEFAPVNTDAQELKMAGKNFDLLEINNGSVFCVCLLGEFIKSLEDFIVRYSPDLLILEASGLSDTTSIAEIVTNNHLRERIFPVINWCVVDALNFHRAGKMLPRMIHQIMMADIILINKTDLAESSGPFLANELKELNPFAEIINTVFCRVSFNFKRFPLPRIAKADQMPLARPGINSMVIKSTRRFTEISLHEFLELWSPLAYRIKGFAVLADNSVMAVQSVMGNSEFRPALKWTGPTELIALSDQFQLHEWNSSFRQHTN
jgi:G3E family GTPase